MALKIKPLSDRVLIEPVAAETKTASGIFIPDTAKEKPQKGTVVAVGNGTKDHTMTVKIGDTVLTTGTMSIKPEAAIKVKIAKN
jgi:chaperonin GroES